MGLDEIISAMFSAAGIVLIFIIIFMVIRKRKKELGSIDSLFKYGLLTLIFGFASGSLLYFANDLKLMINKFDNLTHVVSDNTFLKVYDNQDDFLLHLGFPIIAYILIYLIAFTVFTSLFYISIHNLVVSIKEFSKRLKDKPYGRLQIALEMDKAIDDIPKERLVKAFFDYQNSKSTEEIYYNDLEYIVIALLECDYDEEAKEALNKANNQKYHKINKVKKLSYFNLKERFLYFVEKRKGIKVKLK